MSTENFRGWSLIALLTALVLLAGCESRNEREARAEIISNYTAFRKAIEQHDLNKAKTFVAESYGWDVVVTNGYQIFGTLTNSESSVNEKAYIRFNVFGTNNAWLYPQGLKVGAVAREFVKQTNGWKLTGNVMPVYD